MYISWRSYASKQLHRILILGMVLVLFGVSAVATAPTGFTVPYSAGTTPGIPPVGSILIGQNSNSYLKVNTINSTYDYNTIPPSPLNTPNAVTLPYYFVVVDKIGNIASLAALLAGTNAYIATPTSTSTFSMQATAGSAVKVTTSGVVNIGISSLQGASSVAAYQASPAVVAAVAVVSAPTGFTRLYSAGTTQLGIPPFGSIVVLQGVGGNYLSANGTNLLDNPLTLLSSGAVIGTPTTSLLPYYFMVDTGGKLVSLNAVNLAEYNSILQYVSTGKSLVASTDANCFKLTAAVTVTINNNMYNVYQANPATLAAITAVQCNNNTTTFGLATTVIGDRPYGNYLTSSGSSIPGTAVTTAANLTLSANNTVAVSINGTSTFLYFEFTDMNANRFKLKTATDTSAQYLSLGSDRKTPTLGGSASAEIFQVRSAVEMTNCQLGYALPLPEVSLPAGTVVLLCRGEANNIQQLGPSTAPYIDYLGTVAKSACCTVDATTKPYYFIADGNNKLQSLNAIYNSYANTWVTAGSLVLNASEVPPECVLKSWNCAKYLGCNVLGINAKIYVVPPATAATAIRLVPDGKMTDALATSATTAAGLAVKNYITS